MRAAVIVPTNRPERIAEFCQAWEPQLHRDDVRLIVVEDAPHQTAALPDWAEHYCWQDIDSTLGGRASCIARRSGAIRSYGFWLAGRCADIDMIVSLDDDVRPLPGNELSIGLLSGHWWRLEQPQALRWFETLPGARVRGYPYSLTLARTVLNHGLWTGVPDLDAITQLREAFTLADTDATRCVGHRLVAPGQYLPICAMNVAFRREAAPVMFLPPLPDGMKRWDDIWSGVVFKRVADIQGWAVTSGPPCIRHERASDPHNNLRQEFLGYGLNERFWQVVDAVQIKGRPIGCYRAIVAAIRGEFPELRETCAAMEVWSSLWGE